MKDHLRIVRFGLVAIAIGASPACLSESESPEPAPPRETSGSVAAALTTEDVVLHAATAAVHPGWSVVVDATAASGARLENPDANVAKIGQASATPAHYFDMSFDAVAGRPYHLWLRMKAVADSYANDSVHVQFSDSIDGSGNPATRIGSTASLAVVLEECDGAGRHGWGWADNGWCGLGASVTFATTGRHTIRIQQREDGVAVDQIVISPTTYATRAPGTAKDDVTKLPAQGGSTTTVTPPTTTGALKVLTWNTSGPLGTAAVDLVAAQSPQVVFLEEVDSVALVESLRVKLAATQGGTWEKAVISRGTDTSSSYVAIVSKFPLANVLPLTLRKAGTYVVPCYDSVAHTFAGRAAVGATITVAGKAMSVFGTRMTSENDRGCLREEENAALKAWANARFPAPHIFGGDFNMQPEAAEREYQVMLDAPYPAIDTWALAVGQGTAVSYDGNPRLSTPTRSTRMDYVFVEQPGSTLVVRGAQIVDVGSLSDHRMMMTSFDVK